MAHRLRVDLGMNAERTRLMFLSQHDQLRAHIETASRLAALYRTGESSAPELDLALDVLREELTAHDQMETVAIHRLMHGHTACGRTCEW